MTDIELKDGERVNQLFSSDVKIIQNREVFSYSVDSVLLALSKIAQARIDRRSLRWKWGRGTFARYCTEAQIIGVEIQERLYGYGYPLHCSQ